MKNHLVAIMLLLIGGSGTLYAQNHKGDAANPGDPFYIPPSAIMDSFDIALDKGNSLHIGLSSLADLPALKNVDSVIQEFQRTMHPFEDSLSHPLRIKKISYLTDEAGRTWVRLQQFKPQGTNYLLKGNQKAALKIQQDTVRIIRVISGNEQEQKGPFPKRYLVMVFHLNDFHQLYQYKDKQLSRAVEKIYDAAKSQTHWSMKNNHNMKLTGSYSLAEAQAGDIAHVRPRYKKPDYLELLLQVNLQNVYQHLSPSASLGVGLGFPRNDKTHEFSLAWEPMFLFAKDNQGVWQTYRNDWLMVQYSRFFSSNKKAAFTGNFSLSYLVRRKGDFFDKHTFRLGLGGFKKDKLTLVPILYFHDFFRGVTPGLRLSVSF